MILTSFTRFLSRLFEFRFSMEIDHFLEDSSENRTALKINDDYFYQEKFLDWQADRFAGKAKFIETFKKQLAVWSSTSLK